MNAINRVNIKKLIILIIAVVTATSVMVPVCFTVPTYPSISSEAAILIDEQSGTVIMHKNKDTKIFCPIINELMTILLAIEKGSFQSNVTISRNAASIYGSSFYLEPGEIIPLEDLLSATMLKTSYDALTAIAEHISGNVESFVKIMNERAVELNMKNTVFENPTGAYSVNNVTTASDMAIFLKHVLANKSYRDLMLAQIKSLTRDTNQQIIVNQNQLLFMQNEEVTGGKCMNPIYTSPLSAVTLATKNNMDLVAVILRSSSTEIFNDTLKILEYGYNYFKKDILISKNEKVTNIEVADQSIGLVADKTIYYVFPIGDIYISDISLTIKPDLMLPLTTSDLVGSAHYKLKNNSVIDVNLYPEKDYFINRGLISELFIKLEENRDIAIFVGLLIILEIIMIIFSSVRAIKRLLNKNRG